MNVLNLKTGEPFDPLPRLHHRPETSLAVSSSELSVRARGMLLGAKSFYVGGRKWTNPYQTSDNAMLAMWDGEWNAGGGSHDATLGKIVDLSGNGYDATIEFDSMCSIGDNYIFSDRTKAKAKDLAKNPYVEETMSDGLTTQIKSFVCVCRRDSQSSNSSLFVFSSKSYKRRVSFNESNMRFKVGRGPYFGDAAGDSSFGFHSFGANYLTENDNYVTTIGSFSKGERTTPYSGWDTSTSVNSRFTLCETGNWSYLYGYLYTLVLYSRHLTDDEFAQMNRVSAERFGF